MIHKAHDTTSQGDFLCRLGLIPQQQIASGEYDNSLERSQAVALAIEELKRRVATQIRVIRDRRIETDEVVQRVSLRLLHISTSGKFDPNKCKNPWFFVDGVVRKVILEFRREFRSHDPIHAAYLDLKPGTSTDVHLPLETEDDIKRVREEYHLLTPKLQDALLHRYPFLQPERTPPTPQGPNQYVNLHRALKCLRAALWKKGDD